MESGTSLKRRVDTVTHQNRIGQVGMPLMLAFLFLVIPGPSFIAAQGLIVQPPTSVVVFPDTLAEFTCEVAPDALSGWFINGINIRNLPEEVTDDISVMVDGTLTVTGRIQYNNTEVQCQALMIGEHERSENVTLTIQGRLASVGKVTVDSNSDSISLTWNPPFSLNVTGLEPDIWYSVLIINVTDEDSPTAVSCTDCLNLTQPHYTYTPDYPSPCNNYSFTVISKNGAGEGNWSDPIHGIIFPRINGSAVNATRAGDGDGGSIIIIILSESKKCTESYTLYFFGVSTGENCDRSFSCGPLKEQNLQLTCSAGGNNLPLNCRYNVTIESEGIAGRKANSTGNITLSTYDVQDSDNKSVGPGTVDVTGELANNTGAQGCFIVFDSMSDSSEHYQIAMRSRNFCNTTVYVTPDNYLVFVYDLEGNQLPGSTPADSFAVFVEENSNGPNTPFTSKVLINAIIDNSTELELTVTCMFKKGVVKPTCVVIWHKKEERRLQNMTLNTEAPSTITNEIGEYFVAVFGMGNGNIETMPFLTKDVLVKRADTPSRTLVASRFESADILVIAVPSAIVLLLLLLLPLVLIIIGIVVCHHRKKNRVQNKSVEGESGEEHVNYFRVAREEPTGNDNKADSRETGDQTVDSTVPNETGDETARERVQSKSEDRIRLISGPVSSDGGESTGVAFKVAKSADGGDITYSEVVVTSAGKKGRTVDSAVPYETVDLTATKRKAHPYGLLYAELGAMPDPKKKTPQKKLQQYVDLVPQGIPPPRPPKKKPPKKSPPKKPSVPLTVENVMDLLRPVAEKWKEIAEQGLGIDEDEVDEIFTNNELEVDCMYDCMERLKQKGLLSWKKLAEALRTVGEEALAEKALENGGSDPQDESEDCVGGVGENGGECGAGESDGERGVGKSGGEGDVGESGGEGDMEENGGEGDVEESSAEHGVEETGEGRGRSELTVATFPTHYDQEADDRGDKVWTTIVDLQLKSDLETVTELVSMEPTGMLDQAIEDPDVVLPPPRCEIDVAKQCTEDNACHTEHQSTLFTRADFVCQQMARPTMDQPNEITSKKKIRNDSTIASEVQWA